MYCVVGLPTPRSFACSLPRCAGFCSPTFGMGVGLLSLLSDICLVTHLRLTNREALLREAYNRSTLRLQTQEQLAMAADQRGIIAAAAAFAAAGLASRGSEAVSLAEPVYLSLFVISGIVFLASSVPGQTYTAGSSAGELKEVIDGNLRINLVLQQLCDNNDKYIEKNDTAARRRSRVFLSALVLFVIGGILFAIGPIANAALQVCRLIGGTQ